MSEFMTVSTSSPWEGTVGYSRAVRAGTHVFVAGTMAANTQGEIQSPGNPYEQTIYAFRKAEMAMQEAGAKLENVVRTRMYITNIAHQEEVGRAHAELFSEIRPAATMLEVSRLASPEAVVEIEMDAIIR